MTDIVKRLRDYRGGDVSAWRAMEGAADEIERLRAALEELIWYANQLELDVYDPSEWTSEHSAVTNARAALTDTQEPRT